MGPVGGCIVGLTCTLVPLAWPPNNAHSLEPQTSAEHGDPSNARTPGESTLWSGALDAGRRVRRPGPD